MHDLLTERAAADGAAMAISDGATTLTYGALESTADRVAQVLLELGVGVEDRVGVMLSASVDALVSIMAVLKVGAAYVPVDPEHPTSRLRWMADDSQLTALIGPSARAREIISPTTPVLDLERDAVRVTTASPLDFRPAVSPDNLAYVIYTSGTTGRPKGVAVEHRSVVAFASALDRRLRNVLPAGARVALNASLSFDASVQQWTRLLFGDTLVPIPRDLRLETAEW